MRSAIIFNFLIEANIMASIAIVMMAIIRRVARRKLGNSALCFGWLLIAVRLLCPVSLPNPLIYEIHSPFSNDPVIRPIAGQVKIRMVDAISSLGQQFLQSGNKKGFDQMRILSNGISNGYPEMLAWLWLAGVIVVLLWIIASNYRFRRKALSNVTEAIPEDLEKLYYSICKARGVKPVPVYFADPIPSACLVGVLHPVIIVPLVTSPQDIQYVLSHEVCHLKNKDHISNMIRMVCCALHWFNPIIWIAASMHRTDCELRCDDSVSHPMNDQERKIYARTLIMAASQKDRPGLGVMATGMTIARRKLQWRVKAIVEHVQPYRSFAIIFILLSLICLLGAFATSETKVRLKQGVYLPLEEHYLTESLEGKLSIFNQEDAIEYANGLQEWMGCASNGDASAFRQENGYWCVSIIDEDNGIFDARFLTNGNVLALRQVCPDEYWEDSPLITDSNTTNHQAIIDWLHQCVESMNPGLCDLLSPMRIIEVRDCGNALYACIGANPNSIEYDAGLYAIVKVDSDEGYFLRELSIMVEW
ncbi:MAG: hypothetical protein IKH57_03430 [Clostridia bacterium]|nr:hypothetical protein [Clostridia bacterium]